MREALHWRIEDSKRNTQVTVHIVVAAVAAGLERRTPAGPTDSEQVSHSTDQAATEYLQEDRRGEGRDVVPFD